MPAALAEAHRLAQARLGAQVVMTMHSAWPILDPENLDGTFENWLGVVEPIIQANRLTSAGMAAAYLTTLRAQQLGPDGLFTPALAAPGDVEAIRVSMLVTGPVSIRTALGRTANLATAVDVAEARSSAAAMRHVLNAGRETIGETVQHDRRSRGYERVTSGKACEFCASLAGRVFAANADFPAHDGCSCSAEPVFG
jgi:hypothetical protein